MAKRSRERRYKIPGYDESRPSREQRKQEHRSSRHSTHQKLHMVDDPDEVEELPEVRRTRNNETFDADAEPEKRRFKVRKTKFWKRRDDYHEMKAEMDADWPVITPEQLREDTA